MNRVAIHKPPDLRPFLAIEKLPPYWREYCRTEAAYAFTPHQAQTDLLAAAKEVRQLYLSLVERAVESEEMMDSLGIAPQLREAVVESWKQSHPAMCERLDLIYNGRDPAKFIECNADNPGDLCFCGPFLDNWIVHCREHGAISTKAFQINRQQEVLVASFRRHWPDDTLHHFTAEAGEDEDWSEIAFISACARMAGMRTDAIAFEDIVFGADERWSDRQGRPIQILHKRLSWDKLIAAGGTLPPRIIEPAWKVLLESKGILPWLWRLFPGHPNLLPAWFEGDSPPGRMGATVSKPIWSRRGANVKIHGLDGERHRTGGQFLGRRIRQVHCPLPEFDDESGKKVRALTSVWITDGVPVGIRVMETASHILTAENGCFVPSFIEGPIDQTHWETCV